MKKIAIIITFAIIFLCTFFLIFFTGKKGADNDPSQNPNGNTEAYNYDLSEYVTLGDFPKIKADEALVKELVDNAVESIATSFAEKKNITDRPVQNGDSVNIDYVGTLDGVAFEGGTANGADLVIGSNSFIPGFESGLIGKNVGEEVALDITFPTDYHSEEMAGKAVVFTVKINSITEIIVPELTDTMILALKSTEYKNVAEFNAFVKKLAVQSALWEAYYNSCKIEKYPDTEVNKYYDNIIANYTAQASYYNTNLDTLVSAMGYSNVEEFYADVRKSAQNTVGMEMIIYQTARKHKITISDDEYQTYGLALAKENNCATLEELEKSVDKDVITVNVYQKKLVDVAYENSNG